MSKKNRYAVIGNYLQFLNQYYNLHICIKDFCGFVPINKELDEVLQPYLGHTNDYCMYIKKDRQIYYKCLSLIPKMYEKCSQGEKSFFGMCHAGLGEYVTPITSRGVLIGTLNMGFFSPGKLRSQFAISRVCQLSPELDEKQAIQLYTNTISEPLIDPKELLPTMELLADYLAMSYESLLDTHTTANSYRRYDSSEDDILSHAYQFIHQNFIRSIPLAELADACHCSESYISRIFKRRTGININTYINKVRIEASKGFLVKSNRSISDIAVSVGFGDPNYYSRVFNQLVGIPPREYKRRFTQDKLDDVSLER